MFLSDFALSEEEMKENIMVHHVVCLDHDHDLIIILVPFFRPLSTC